MTTDTKSSVATDPHLADLANKLFETQKESIFRSTNRLFAGLMIFQWLFCVVISLIVSPRTWAGAQSELHPHIYDAVLLGACIVSLPIYLGFRRPDSGPTRYVMSIAQMLVSALLIHLTGGRIETHFHIFGSLAFLAFYRDWKVLIPATAVVLLDHFVRGILVPHSVFGVDVPNFWRPLEHTGWVIFEDAFLIASCIKSTREMRLIAENTAHIQGTNERLRLEGQERQAVVEALRLAGLENQRLAAAIEFSQVGVIISDSRGADSRTIFVNPAYSAITGYERGEVLGRSCRILQGPDTDPQVVEKIRRALENGRPFRGTILNYRKNGRPFWNELQINPVFDETGQVIHFVGLQSDVTARVEAEAALAASEERYRSVVNSTYEVLFQMDEEFSWSFLNRAWTFLTGHKVEESLGAHYLSFVHEDDRPWVHDKLQLVAQDRLEYCRLEVRFNHRSLEPRWVDLFVRASRDKEGTLTGFDGSLMDITERKLAEMSMRAAQLEAEAANRVKSEFMSRVSHELRTPMNAILGFGQLLDRKRLGGVEGSWIGHIVGAGQHLLSLIDQILDISRIETGTLQFDLEAVSLGDVIEDVRGSVKDLAKERHVEVKTVTGDVNGAYVRADGRRLRQILLNLITNGIQYNSYGGWVEIRCTKLPSQMGNRFRVEVVDNGNGMQPDHVERAFSPFQKLDSKSSTNQGAGLGLTSAKYLAESMGGKIGIHSRPAEGTVVWLELPEFVVDSGEGDDQVEAVRSVSRVLCIEDNDANLKLVEDLLSTNPGIVLLTAGDGERGVEMAKEELPDAILLDLHLPGLLGWDVLEKLRNSEETRHIPIIVLSADVTSSQRERLLRAGATKYFTKPLDTGGLLEAIQEVLV